MSNGLSQAEIDALLNGDSTPAEDPNAMMSADDIAAAFASTDNPGDGLSPMSEEEIAAAFAATDMPVDDDPNRKLSSDEIAALINASGGDADGLGGDLQVFEGVITPDECDAMGEIGNICMGTSATTLFALLNRRVDITTPRVVVTTMQEIARVYPLPFVAVEVKYTVGLEGTNVLFMREHDVKIITDLMMGGDGSNTDAELTEMHLSCIGEVMNQMMGSASTSLAKMLNTPIDISPPRAYQVNLNDPAAYPFSSTNEPIVRTSFDMVVEGLINSEIMQITPVPFAQSMVKTLLGDTIAQTATTIDSPAASAPPPPATPQQGGIGEPIMNYTSPFDQYPVAPNIQNGPSANDYNAQFQQQPYGVPQQQQQQQGGYPPYPPQGGGYPPYPPQQGGYPPYPPPPQQGGGYPPYGADPYGGGYPPYPPYGAPPQQHAQPVDVRPMKLANFGDGRVAEFMGENMDMLMDVPLQVSVELGKSKKYIKEIVDFNVGTIIVLDKMAGELVDVVVNGKLIAKGEVVVIEESYGCRITDIISPSKRIHSDK